MKGANGMALSAARQQHTTGPLPQTGPPSAAWTDDAFPLAPTFAWRSLNTAWARAATYAGWQGFCDAATRRPTRANAGSSGRACTPRAKLNTAGRASAKGSAPKVYRLTARGRTGEDQR